MGWGGGRANRWKNALLAVLLGLVSSMMVSTLRVQFDTHRYGEMVYRVASEQCFEA